MTNIIEKMTIKELLDLIDKGRSLACYYEDETYNDKVEEVIDALKNVLIGSFENNNTRMGYLNNCVEDLLEKTQTIIVNGVYPIGTIVEYIENNEKKKDTIKEVSVTIKKDNTISTCYYVGNKLRSQSDVREI